MRITGGRTKGRLLARLKDPRIRPTSDRVREAIFDLIGHELSEHCVLDLFAGTGSLGLEALSRGASQAVFVDYSPKAIQIIKKNIGLCEFEHCSRIMRRDLRKRFPEMRPLGENFFQLVFMDPPYRTGLIPVLMGKLGETVLLSPGALLVAESSKNEDLPAAVGSFVRNDTRTYGDTRITIYIYEVKK